MKLGIIVAMDKEYDQIASLHSENIVLAKSGLGKVNAAITATNMIMNDKPDCIISTGCAGGLAPELNVMDVVVAKQTGYHDVDCGADYEPGQMAGMPVRYDADEKMYNIAMGLKSADGKKIVGGFLCSGDLFCTTPEQSGGISARFPDAIAVDMESAAIAQVCYRYKIPFLSFRIISDTIGKDNDQRISEYWDFWATLAKESFEIFKQFIAAI